MKGDHGVRHEGGGERNSSRTGSGSAASGSDQHSLALISAPLTDPPPARMFNPAWEANLENSPAPECVFSLAASSLWVAVSISEPKIVSLFSGFTFISPVILEKAPSSDLLILAGPACDLLTSCFSVSGAFVTRTPKQSGSGRRFEQRRSFVLFISVFSSG